MVESQRSLQEHHRIRTLVWNYPSANQVQITAFVRVQDPVWKAWRNDLQPQPRHPVKNAIHSSRGRCSNLHSCMTGTTVTGQPSRSQRSRTRFTSRTKSSGGTIPALAKTIVPPVLPLSIMAPVTDRPRLPTCLDMSEHQLFYQLRLVQGVAAAVVSLPVNCLSHPCNLHYWPQRLAKAFPWPLRRAKEMRSWLSSSLMAVESKFNISSMLQHLLIMLSLELSFLSKLYSLSKNPNNNLKVS